MSPASDAEGLMAVVFRLEEEAKEFFDEIDTLTICATYIGTRSCSKALFSLIGGCVSFSIETGSAYLITALCSIAMALFSQDTFHERKVAAANIAKIETFGA